MGVGQRELGLASWLWAGALLCACSSSHRGATEDAAPDAEAAEACGADAECAAGRVCVARRCVAQDAGTIVETLDAAIADRPDAAVADPLIEQVVVWRKPLDHLPTDATRGAIDLAVGEAGDVWLLGQLAQNFTSRLWLERMGPDGSRRWPEPWTSELEVSLFGVDRSEPVPAGFFVVDDLGRATVAGAATRGGGPPLGFWLSQVDPGGVTRWTVDDDAYYVSDLDVDDEGRVYAALGQLLQDGVEPGVTVARWLPDARRDSLLPLESTLKPPLTLVVPPSDDGDNDGAFYLAGARPQGFGGYEAFIGRYGLLQLTDTWPARPPPTGPEDYSSVVDAASDGQGGIVAAVSTAYPMYDIAYPLDSTEGLREVRHYDAAGTLLWSTPMRDDTGEDRIEGLAEWQLRLAVAGDGSIYAAYAVLGDHTATSTWGPTDVVVDKLLPDGRFAWRAPVVVHEEQGLRPTGLAAGPGGELYLLASPRLANEEPWIWLSRLDPSAAER